MRSNNCLTDLHLIDRSSFTLEPRSEESESTQPHNPFIRTQSLFRKKASQEMIQKQSQQAPPAVVHRNNTLHQTSTRQERIYDHILDHKDEMRVSNNDMSFFDSFGKTLDDRQLRIKTQPCEIPTRSLAPTQPNNIAKPVTQFFLNLNSLPADDPEPKQKSKPSLSKQYKPNYDLFETVKRLHSALEEADQQSRKHLTEQIPEKLLVELRRLTIKLELTNRENQENTKSSRCPKLVKQRDCLDRNRKVHIQMVKVDHRSPECNSYRKGKSTSKPTGLYALKSRLHLK